MICMFLICDFSSAFQACSGLAKAIMYIKSKVQLPYCSFFSAAKPSFADPSFALPFTFPFIFPGTGPIFLFSFSPPSSTSSSSSSLLTSFSSCLKTTFHAMRRMKNSQKILIDCKIAKRPKVMYWAIQHLYCPAFQSSS